MWVKLLLATSNDDESVLLWSVNVVGAGSGNEYFQSRKILLRVEDLKILKKNLLAIITIQLSVTKIT